MDIINNNDNVQSTEEDNDDFDIYGDLNGCKEEQDDRQVQTLPSNHVLIGNTSQTSMSSLDDTLNDEALLFSELNFLQTEIKALRNDNATLSKENGTLKTSLELKDKQIKVLKCNISSLYKTAKLELDRKCQELADLRREHDILIFRRISSKTNDLSSAVLPIINIQAVPITQESSNVEARKRHMSTKENNYESYNTRDTNGGHHLTDELACDNNKMDYSTTSIASRDDHDRDLYSSYDRKSRHSTDSSNKRKHSPLHTNQEMNQSVKSIKCKDNESPKSSRHSDDHSSSGSIRKSTSSRFSSSHRKYNESSDPRRHERRSSKSDKSRS